MNTPDSLIGWLANEAAKMADKTDGVGRYRVGACGVGGRNGFRATWRGFNSYKTHPIQKYLNFHLNPYRDSLHAEVDVMIRSKWRCTTLVVVRIKKAGSWAMSRPCEGCQRALKGVEVWYSTGNGMELKRL